MKRTCFNPTCSNEVEAKTNVGRSPMCEDCKIKGRVAYNQRQRDARASKPKLSRTRMCVRCQEAYEYTPKRGYNKGVCGPCLPLLDTERREERLEKRRQRSRRYREDPEYKRRRSVRFAKKLRDLGLEIASLDDIRCGICSRNSPGARNWHFDHDHSCCGPRAMCDKCFRGLLCSGCNVGLGHFSDDPVRLRRAADWVERRK